MNIAVNKAHFPVTVLGPGRRIGIWMQGCSIRCKGCVSQDTWMTDKGREMPVTKLIAWCKAVSGGVLDGVTLSGGEPFDQPRALAALLKALQAWRRDAGLDFDILCYSGHPLKTLEKRHPQVLLLLDALIPEPYVDTLPLTQVWRGSHNQPLLPLTPRGKERYADYLDAPAESFGKRMQISVDGERVWYVGIPARGDMATLEALCEQRGLNFAQVSWRQ